MNASSSAGPPVCGLGRFSDHDTRILGRARHLPGMPGPAAVRACTAPPPSRTATPRTRTPGRSARPHGRSEGCSPSSGASPTPDRKRGRIAWRVWRRS